MPTGPQKLSGVILDVDGTLIDSNDAHAGSWVDAFQEFGFRVPFEKVRPLIGMGGDKLMPAAVGVKEDSDRGKAISARRGEIFRERYLHSIKPFPGARALLERMRERGLRLAVATSSNPDDADALLDVAGVKDLLEERTDSGDAEGSKPDPDIVRAALRRLKLKPAQVVMLGDTPYDIEAASRAGIKTIALRCGGWSDAALEGAVAIFRSPADLLVRFDESPLAQGQPREGARAQR